MKKKGHLIRGFLHKIYLPLFILVMAAGCRQSYNPPSIKNNPNFLVVDGFLNGNPDSTFITLTRTRNLIDSVPGIPESGASLTVEGDDYSSVPVKELGNGVYSSILSLHTFQKYRLNIKTTDGQEYVSDFVPFKQTPAIDSVSWKEDSTDVSIFVNTHDPQNNTRFYRWEYEETWQYHTYLRTNSDYINGQVVKGILFSGI